MERIEGTDRNYWKHINKVRLLLGMLLKPCLFTCFITYLGNYTNYQYLIHTNLLGNLHLLPLLNTYQLARAIAPITTNT